MVRMLRFENVTDLKRQPVPAKSKAQQRLMQLAAHAPDKVFAKNKGVLKMSHNQLHDFSVGSEKGKPEHVAKTFRRKIKFPMPSKMK